VIKRDKVLGRIARAAQSPEILDHVARDVGVALAAGQREALAAIARELAAHAPSTSAEAPAGRAGQPYWAGFAAGMGTLLAAYEASFQHADARESARRAVAGDLAQSIVLALGDAPATGVDLAARVGATPGAVSKILGALRGAGLARVLGGLPYPKRGARKPHALTPLGVGIADELRSRRRAGGRAAALVKATGSV
jgi:CRP-like cAMP-binding protein